MQLFILIVILLVIFNIVKSVRAANKPVGPRNGRSKAQHASAALNSMLNRVSSREDRNLAWMQSAGKLGLAYRRPATPLEYPEISGTFAGFSVLATIQNEDDGSVSTVYTLNFPKSLGLGLLAAKDTPEALDTMFHDRAEVLPKLLSSMSDIRVAVEQKDKFLRFMTDLKAGAMRKLMNQYPGVTITDRFIRVRTPGAEDDAARLETVLNVMSAVAEEFMSPVPAAASADPLVYTAPKPQPKPVPTVFQPLPKHVDPVAEDVKQNSVPVPEVKTPAVVQAPVFQPLPKHVDPVAEDVKQNSVSAPAAVRKPVSVREQPVPEASSAVSDDAAAFCTGIFKGGFPSAAEKAALESLKGTQVRWSAVLMSAQPFHSDFVLGNTPGVKAVFELCETEGKFGVKNKIKAVAAFDSAALDTLKSAVGQSVTFQAVLLKVELFTREVFLKDASL